MEIISGKNLPSGHIFFRECAYLHRKEIPDGFLPKLGLGFLSGMYEFFSISKHSFLFLAIEDSKVLGFIAVSLNTKLFYKHYLVRHSFKDFYKIPFAVLGKTFLKNVLEVLRYPFNKKSLVEEFQSKSEIFNFCVDGSAQGKGVGQKLFSASNEIDLIKIVTGNRQVGAQNFYRKSGAEFSHKITVHEGEDSLVFKYVINGV